MFKKICAFARTVFSGVLSCGVNRSACVRFIVLCAVFSVHSAVCCCAGSSIKPNVVLISLNALRADHLKTYGYATDIAPNITRLAGESAVFEQAVAQSHWTLPSLASLFTSKYVHSHGVYERGRKLAENELTLAEILKASGYKTAAFTGGLDMAGDYGLRQGFDFYFDDTKDKPMGSFKDIVPEAVKWLAANKDNKVFLFVDAYDIHPPFDKPAAGPAQASYAGVLQGLLLDYNLLKDFKNGDLLFKGKKVKLTREDIDYVHSRYDAGISYSDRFIGELLAEIQELGLSGKTVIILTAEHGEELADHGSFDRFGSQNIYEEVVRVPLLIKVPGLRLKSRRVKAQVQLIDLMPTILELSGTPINSGVQGVSLAGVISGREKEADFNRFVFSEAGVHKWVVRTIEWKLIYDEGKYELYDLLKDKLERNNLAEKQPAVVYELVQKLLEWRRKTKMASSPDDTRVTLTKEMKQRLKEAGYW